LQVISKLPKLLTLGQLALTPYQTLVIGFGALILFGAFLLMTPIASTAGNWTPFIDALFTATSAVCVTGLVVVDTGTYFSLFGQLVVLALIQAGGLGIMTLTTLMAIIAGKKIRLRERLVIQEAMNQLALSGVVRLTIYIIKATLILEFVGGTILALRWYMDYGATGIYFGYWHAISAFCNAGFDLFGGFNSITHYVEDPIVNITIALLIIFGGIGFTVIADIWNIRNFTSYSFHSKIVISTTLILIFAGMGVILLSEFNNPQTLGGISGQGKLLASFFQSVTARTAGYNTIDIGSLKEGTLFFIIILMFIGASPGSTGGGIKTTTAATLFLALLATARGNNHSKAFGREIDCQSIQKAFTLTMVAVLLVTGVTFAMTFSEEASFIKILFEVTSAFGTVGLSTGITPSLSSIGKLLIIVTMFAGRVGTLTIVMAIALKINKEKVQYPEGKILIG
jgi:trk system potassium uptake protein